MKTFETKEAFLLDALEYYTADTNRRCIGGNEVCFYSPKAAGNKLSEGCIIGRNASPGSALEMDEYEESVAFFIKGDLLPEWMKAFGVSFLIDCQNLHDGESYWDEEGLSSKGKERVEYIITKYSLDKSQFKKYTS